MTDEEVQDIIDSFTLAMTAEGIGMETINNVVATVRDAIDNNS